MTASGTYQEGTVQEAANPYASPEVETSTAERPHVRLGLVLKWLLIYLPAGFNLIAVGSTLWLLFFGEHFTSSNDGMTLVINLLMWGCLAVATAFISLLGTLTTWTLTDAKTRIFGLTPTPLTIALCCWWLF